MGKGGRQGMSTIRIPAILVMGVALIAVSGYSPLLAACEQPGCSWLATGAVSKIDGSTFYLLGRDNIVYTIDASHAQLLSGFTKEPRSVRAGDCVRVYGTITGSRRIQASRVRVMVPASEPTTADEPKKEIKIIYERPQPGNQEGAGPQTDEQAQEQCPWDGHGLITDIDYTGRQLKIRTSAGPVTINFHENSIVQGQRRIAAGRLSLGDAVRVVGSLVDTNLVDARQVRVLRTKTEAENALPQTPISIVGIIQQIDYPSLTFRMWTESYTMVVMADKDTVIQQQQLHMSFCDLKSGMKIKMNGNGALGIGFTAREILIIGVAP